MSHYKTKSKGGYLTKLILYRYYSNTKRNITKWLILSSSTVSTYELSKTTELLHILYSLRSHLVQRKLFFFNVLLQTKHTSEVGFGFNLMSLDSNNKNLKNES